MFRPHTNKPPDQQTGPLIRSQTDPERLGLHGDSSTHPLLTSAVCWKKCVQPERERERGAIRGSAGTQTWISLAWVGGDWDDSGNHSVPQRRGFAGVASVQQPGLADVNSSTLTELLRNPEI